MAQGVKGLAATPDNLSLIPEAQKVEGENELRKLFSDPLCVPTNK